MKNQRNTLVYVDRSLAIAIAAKIVGVLSSYTEERHTKGGINWLVSASIGATKASSDQTDIREMLPEDLIYYLFPKISDRYEGVSCILQKMNTVANEAFVPGNVLSVPGKLIFLDMPNLGDYSPFDTGTDIKLPVNYFHGEHCIVAKLTDDNYELPIYFPEIAKYQIIYCHNQPTEVTGIVRWVPPYTPGGAHSLNLAIRCAALWLR